MSISRNFENKVVLVTGSSSGIGEASVVLFSKLGAKVVVTGRDAQKVEAVTKKCEQVSPQNLKPLQVVADVSKEEDVDRLMQTVIQHYGQLDVLVNNAGQGGGKDVESLQDFDEFMNINLRSVYQLSYLALPHLEKTKGAIVNNSSICGLKPFPHSVSYCVSKAGIDMMTRCFAVVWGPKGIRVNSVCPGQIDTPIFSRYGKMTQQQLDTMWKAVGDKIPVRRPGHPDDIANAIAFLASEDSGFITGVNLKIDGGFLDSPTLIWE